MVNAQYPLTTAVGRLASEVVHTERVTNTNMIKLLSWNIAGRHKNMANPEWKEFIDTFDICMFQETWSMSPLYKCGYSTHFIPAISSGRGRPSGGLHVWFSVALNWALTAHTLQSQDILHISTKGSHIGSSMELFNVYAIGSPGGQTSPTIALLEVALAGIPPLPSIIVGGDFNYTYEPLSKEDLLGLNEEDSRQSIPPLTIAPIRKWTPRAIQINSLTLEYNLRTLNGRTTSDPNGMMTYNRFSCPSRIDYILLDTGSWNRLVDMEVRQSQDSNHNPLCMEIRWGNEREALNGPLMITKEVVPSNCKRRLKWNRVMCQEDILIRIKELVEAETRELLSHTSAQSTEQSRNFIDSYKSLIEKIG